MELVRVERRKGERRWKLLVPRNSEEDDGDDTSSILTIVPHERQRSGDKSQTKHEEGDVLTERPVEDRAQAERLEVGALAIDDDGLGKVDCLRAPEDIEETM